MMDVKENHRIEIYYLHFGVSKANFERSLIHLTAHMCNSIDGIRAF